MKENNIYTNNLHKYLLSFFIYCIAPSYAVAKVNVSSSIQVEGINQKVKRDSDEDLSLQTYSLNPIISGYYQSRTIEVNASASHTYLERDNDTVSSKNNFSTYQASFNYTPFERILTFNARSSISYRPVNAQNFINTNFISNTDELTKTRNNALGMKINAEQGDSLSASIAASYSKFDTENTETSPEAGFGSTNVSSNVLLENGDEARYLLWKAKGTYQKSQRDNNAAYGDFTSINAVADSDFMLLSWLGLRLSASTETNETTSINSTFSAKREFNTYGVGLTFKQNTNRRISFTWNQSNSNLDSSDNQQFFGTDLFWELTSRTKISAQVGRRFYGSSANADISYNSKFIRSSVRYRESVTNTTRLISTSENLGLFVCPLGSISISDCQQPDSIDYVPQAGEVLVPFSQSLISLDDNIILRKALNANLGYDFSKIKVNLSIQNAKDNFIDLGRERETNSIDLTTSFEISKRTTFNSSIQLSKMSETLVSSESENNEVTTKSCNLNFIHSLGKKIKTNARFTYVDRSGDEFGVLGGGIFGANYSEIQFAVGLSLTYD